MLPCEMMTPLGMPVVPDVYMITAWSSGRRHVRQRLSRARLGHRVDLATLTPALVSVSVAALIKAAALGSAFLTGSGMYTTAVHVFIPLFLIADATTLSSLASAISLAWSATPRMRPSSPSVA